MDKYDKIIYQVLGGVMFSLCTIAFGSHMTNPIKVYSRDINEDGILDVVVQTDNMLRDSKTLFLGQRNELDDITYIPLEDYKEREENLIKYRLNIDKTIVRNKIDSLESKMDRLK